MKKEYYNVPKGTSQQRRPWKFQSRLFPLQVKGEAFSVEVIPLDGVFREVLKERLFNEVYTVEVEPLDFIMKDILKTIELDLDTVIDGVDSNGNPILRKVPDVYTVDVEPLDFTLRLVMKDTKQDNSEAYSVTVEPLDFIMEDVLLVHISQDIPIYTVQVEPLDFTMIKVK